MWDRRRILLAAVLGLLAVGIALASFWNREPRYNGQPLSYWVPMYCNPVTPDERRLLASVHLDAEAIPFLRKWIKTPQGLEASGGTLDMLPPLEASRRKHMLQISVRAEGAKDALVAMGPKAAPAVPELERMLNNGQNDGMSVYIAQSAAYVLGKLGSLGLPVLGAALTNENPNVRRWAAYFLPLQGTNASPFIPRLLEMLTEPDDSRVASRSLRQMNVKPDLLLPRLIQLLENRNPTSRQVAAQSLRTLCKEAYGAISALQQRLSDPDPKVREEVTNALKRIAPEVLTNTMP